MSFPSIFPQFLHALENSNFSKQDMMIIILPAPHSGLGSSGPKVQVSVSGSKISTVPTQNSGRYSFFQRSLTAEFPPDQRNWTENEVRVSLFLTQPNLLMVPTQNVLTKVKFLNGPNVNLVPSFKFLYSSNSKFSNKLNFSRSSRTKQYFKPWVKVLHCSVKKRAYSCKSSSYFKHKTW